MTFLLCDLSNNNPDPDWHELRMAGIVGVWLKASEGETFTDRTFATRRVEARAAGLHVGAYHYGRVGDAKKEAQHFASVVGSLRAGDLLPALDLEVTGGVGPDRRVTFARAFNHEVRALLGRFPLFYSYRAYIEQLGAAHPIGAGLWLADWGVNDGNRHGDGRVPAPHPWKKVLAHQFTSKGSVHGYGPVDLTEAAALEPLLHRP